MGGSGRIPGKGRSPNAERSGEGGAPQFSSYLLITISVVEQSKIFQVYKKYCATLALFWRVLLMRTSGWTKILAILILSVTAGFADAKDCMHPLSLTEAGPYQTAIDAVMRGEGNIDLAELRALYVDQKSFNGRSRLAYALSQMIALADQGGETLVDANCEVMALLVADFPLLETQYAAYRYYEEVSPPDAAAIDFHVSFFQAIRDVIIATKQDGPKGPIYTVLSVGEEYELLNSLQMKFAGKQSLLEIDGKPYDRLETDKGPVLFDISAFFGRELGLE